MTRAAPAFFALLFWPSCGAPAIPPNLAGGRVVVGMSDNFPVAQAEFWSQEEGAPPPWSAIPEGGCAALPKPPHQSGFLDLGKEVLAVHDPYRLRMVRQANLDYLPPEAEGTIGFAVPYQITVGGRPLAKPLRVPDRIMLTSITAAAIELNAGRSWYLQYKPVAADRLDLLFTGEGGALACHLGTGGTFTVPVQVIDALPETGKVTLMAANETEDTLGGKPIQLDGITQVQLTYRKLSSGGPPPPTPRASAKPTPRPKKHR